MAGGAKTTAGPSVMGPAGQRVGPLPGGLTQTAAGRPPRAEPRGAVEEELDLTKMLAVKEDVRERMAAAMALVDAVILLAEEAVLECEQKRKPAIALAGRFVRHGGCGCAHRTHWPVAKESLCELCGMRMPSANILGHHGMPQLCQTAASGREGLQ